MLLDQGNGSWGPFRSSSVTATSTASCSSSFSWLHQFSNSCVNSTSHAFLIIPSAAYVVQCILVTANPVHQDTTGFRRAFTTAHEYAHWIFQDRTLESFTIGGSSEDDFLEVRANAFAAAFLMPRKGPRDYFAGMGLLDEGTLCALGHADIVRVMDHFGVSRLALLYRLQNVGLLSEKEAERLRELTFSVTRVARQLGLRFRAEEPVGLRLLALAKQAWRRGLISAADSGAISSRSGRECGSFLPLFTGRVLRKGSLTEVKSSNDVVPLLMLTFLHPGSGRWIP
ncbi:MAG: ImmA/IrrE family metallo-endopeptidase [Dehalococcoidia bacterium]